MAAQKKKRSPGEALEDVQQLPEEQPLTNRATSVVPFPIVGIGASAGGLGAFKKFFSAMPADSGMAFILIPHLDPSHRSLMVELLARQTAMPVCEAKDRESVEPNTVYVIPPNRSLSLNQGHLCLDGSAKSQGFEVSLDAFFRSLAADQQERAIGIILSGTGSHGVAGLKEIKAVGGMVMAQSPDTAEFDQMPRSAIDTGLIDYILAPENMPDALIKYIRQPYLSSSESIPLSTISAIQIAPILELLRTHSRYDFRCYRNKMLIRRIQRRMGICQIDDVSRYVAYLREHPEEIKALYGDLLIGVTSFFRDPEAFITLQEQVIPELVNRQSGDIPLRVWVPACSTGEEAYSIAILILEQFAAAKKPVNLQVFASDIDDESLDVARHGIYAASELGELTPQRIQQYFVRIDEQHYQVNKQLRGVIVVARQNLISDAPFSKVDLVSCRNLMIYLEPDLQQQIISLFHFALTERGYLLLGCSESIGRQIDLFESVSKKWRIFRRAGSVRHDLVKIPILSKEVRWTPLSRPENGFY